MAVPTHCDLLIHNAVIVDGSGEVHRTGDVAVSGDRIVGVGELSSVPAVREIDATGRAVAPGFIDVHAHDDRLLLSGPDMAPKVSQGVTTVVVGNCGISLAPLPPGRRLPPVFDLLGGAEAQRFDHFGDYLRHLDAAPAAANAAFLVGHTTLRVGAMDRLDRPADDREIEIMREVLTEALDSGAFGLSSGLQYDAAFAATPEEVIGLAELLVPAGGIYATHMRDEGDRVVEALDEALKTGRQAGVRTQISHHKVAGRQNFGRSKNTLEMIERASTRQPVAMDVYPYVAGSTVLNARSAANATRTLITWSKTRPDAAGRDLDELAREFGCTVEECIDRLLPAGGIFFTMAEKDVRRILSHPGSMIGSDGLPHDEKPHPRLWGTFPRVLGHYCRQVGLFTLEDAVHRMTGRPAAVFGIADRGLIRPDHFADLVIFDPLTIEDRATYDDPSRSAAGIETVFVNGVPVWEHGRPTGQRPGRVLRRPRRPGRA